VLPHVKAGRLKALASHRREARADLARSADRRRIGAAGLRGVGWFGLLAPAATPASSVMKLSVDVNRVLAQAEVRAKMTALGADPAATRPRNRALHPRGPGEVGETDGEAGVKAAE